MQKIFDPSPEMTSSINTFEEKPNEGDQFYEEEQLNLYVEALEYVGGTFIYNYEN